MSRKFHVIRYPNTISIHSKTELLYAINEEYLLEYKELYIGKKIRIFGLSRKTILLYKKDCFQHRMMVLGLFDINYSLRVTLSDTFMGKTMAFCPEHPKTDQNL